MSESYTRTLERLKDRLKNAPTPKPPTDKTDKIASDYNLEKAAKLGLVACWSKEFGFVGIHDPASGEWHDVPVKEAPPWALSESRKRKELYRAGDYRAYRLTSEQMEATWHDEHHQPDEGLIDEHEKGADIR